jgi:hypothetical protein
METSKLKRLKAHDYHVLMKQILPMCVCTLMPRGPRLAIIHMNHVFWRSRAKKIDSNVMNDLKEKKSHFVL